MIDLLVPIGPSQYSSPRPIALRGLRTERHLQWILTNKLELRSSLLSHITSNSVTKSSLVDVDRLLIRRAPIAHDRIQPLSWAPALLQVLRVLFRGVLETIRETVFSQTGAGQVQVDISWLRDTLNELLSATRRTSDDSRPHAFGYTVPQRQSQNEESQFRLVSILADEIILSAAASVLGSGVVPASGSGVTDEVELLIRLLIPSDQLDKIIVNEVPLEYF